MDYTSTQSKLYISEIDTLFRQEYKVSSTTIDYSETIEDDVEGWIEFLVFIRKQARFCTAKTKIGDTKAVENAKALVRKCKFIGDIFVPFLVSKIPYGIKSTIIDRLEKREAEEKHMEKLVLERFENGEVTDRTRILNLTPNMSTLPSLPVQIRTSVKRSLLYSISNTSVSKAREDEVASLTSNLNKASLGERKEDLLGEYLEDDEQTESVDRLQDLLGEYEEDSSEDENMPPLRGAKVIKKRSKSENEEENMDKSGDKDDF